MTVCSKYTESAVIEPATLTFGKEEVTCIELGVTVPTDGQSFLISNTKVKYQVWYDVDGGGSAPTPPNGETLIEVAILSTDSIKLIREKTKAAVELVADSFYVHLVSDGEMIFESILDGEVLATAVDVDTTWMIHVITTGFKLDLGNTDAGIEFAAEQSLLEIKANQSGELLLEERLQGTTATLSCGLQSLSKAVLDKLIADGWGDRLVDKNMFGGGTSKIGTGSISLAGRLTIHPIRLKTDLTEDLTFWKCVPTMSGWSYDGTAVKVANAEFKALVDEYRPEEINLYAIGDSTQSLY